MLILPINSKIFVYNIINNIFNEDDKNEIKNKKNILIPRNFNRDWIDDKNKSSMMLNNKFCSNSIYISKNLISNDINTTPFCQKTKEQNIKLYINNEEYQNDNLKFNSSNYSHKENLDSKIRKNFPGFSFYNNYIENKINNKDKHKKIGKNGKLGIDFNNEISKKNYINDNCCEQKEKNLQEKIERNFINRLSKKKQFINLNIIEKIKLFICSFKSKNKNILLFKKIEKRVFETLDVLFYFHNIYEYDKLKQILLDDYQLIALEYIKNDKNLESKQKEIIKKELIETVKTLNRKCNENSLNEIDIRILSSAKEQFIDLLN